MALLAPKVFLNIFNVFDFKCANSRSAHLSLPIILPGLLCREHQPKHFANQLLSVACCHHKATATLFVWYFLILGKKKHAMIARMPNGMLVYQTHFKDSA
jgi:hypothetical protein